MSLVTPALGIHTSKFKRALRVTLGKRAIGSCWAKGPAAVGIRAWLGKVGPYGPDWDDLGG